MAGEHEIQDKEGKEDEEGVVLEKKKVENLTYPRNYPQMAQSAISYTMTFVSLAVFGLSLASIVLTARRKPAKGILVYILAALAILGAGGAIDSTWFHKRWFTVALIISLGSLLLALSALYLSMQPPADKKKPFFPQFKVPNLPNLSLPKPSIEGPSLPEPSAPSLSLPSLP